MSALYPEKEPQPLPLYCCPECGGENMIPLDWQVADDIFWRVVNRCPDCEHIVEGEFPQEMCDVFDTRLDDNFEVFVGSLKELTKENMEAEIGRLAAAFAADVIYVDDIVNWHHELDEVKSIRR
jgi:hypothetical protein